MTSISFFFLLIPILALILLLVNIILAPHNPYEEKDSAFECGFHSFLNQTRSEFDVMFFLYGMLFITFDVEILLIVPYGVVVTDSGYFGLVIALAFVGLLTIGFGYEIGKNALSLDSRQNRTNLNLIKMDKIIKKEKWKK